jgi:hypothetical protein
VEAMQAGVTTDSEYDDERSELLTQGRTSVAYSDESSSTMHHTRVFFGSVVASACVFTIWIVLLLCVNQLCLQEISVISSRFSSMIIIHICR